MSHGADYARHGPRLALRVARTLRPSRVLVLSEQDSDLPELLAEHGIEARADRLSEPRPADAEPWDLVICLDALSSVPSSGAEDLLDLLCATADRVLVLARTGLDAAATQASSPTNPAWAAAFAERQYFRRTDLDLDLPAAWVALFERDSPSLRDLAFRYESALQPLQDELASKQATVLPHSPSADVDTITQQGLDELRHQILTSRDFAMGAEAEIARLRSERDELRALVSEIYGSTRWRVGDQVLNPLSRIKNGVQRFR
ncbi:MAG: methyltransferase protein [Frankiales bacterium]|nr:methyltransferase protein [Frankiales bacterium]